MLLVVALMLSVLVTASLDVVLSRTAEASVPTVQMSPATAALADGDGVRAQFLMGLPVDLAHSQP
jgi:hypothetical protein